MPVVIELGGKQYIIHPNQPVKVEKLAAGSGSNFTTPDLLSHKTVTLTVVEHGLGKKVRARKFRNKSRQDHVIGHRQSYTAVMLQSEPTDEKQTTPRRPRKKAS